MKKMALDSQFKWYLLYLSIYFVFIAGIVFGGMNQISNVIISDTDYMAEVWKSWLK
ncbi:hypothetical protein ERJ70_07090 [Sediminibacillus dalangtanensis]|uniref:Uncharacterized protein n=1 Tax=Sediminibacillus dalangtanensis TaxID=2729421 RepID=A0ABX7VTF2_9BACI|nr:hypothetical protein [Sediminibacillus dalangtanensis]QTM99085.1 hypothetical protein ERJ70_07090 [Sediminibacillus dalangtanensis]